LFLRKNGAFFVKNNSAFCILHYALFIARQSDKLGFPAFRHFRCHYREKQRMLQNRQHPLKFY